MCFVQPGDRRTPAGRCASLSAKSGAWRSRALLGLEHEPPAPIEVDAAGSLAAVREVMGNGALEAIVADPADGGVGPRDVEQVAQFQKERLAVAALGAFAVAPAGDEPFDHGMAGFGHVAGSEHEEALYTIGALR
jgi:hypothetical protein